ncbi:helix-turn-helix domain-containing protein [Streptomyces sp. NBC_00433]
MSAAAVVSPIGAAVAAWRVRRGLSPVELAARSDLPLEIVDDLEAGRTWVDQRRVWASLAAALGVDSGELTGQPFPPTGSEHGEVRAVAHRLRRVLAAVPQQSSERAPGLMEERERLLTSAVAADRAGNDHGLAALAPELICTAERAVREARGAARERAVDLRSQGHAVVAGLLRRLGYRDLAWLVLHRARATDRQGVEAARCLVAEEIRLLLDLGLPEQALGCAERSGHARGSVEMSVLAAFAHAVTGRPDRADIELDAAGSVARNPGSRAAVTAARVTVALEAADIDAASGYAALLDLNELAPADRVASLVCLAASAARGSAFTRAADHLLVAETTAPLRFRLDPFARELMVALPPRLADHDQAEAVRAVARRAGLL